MKKIDRRLAKLEELCLPDEDFPTVIFVVGVTAGTMTKRDAFAIIPGLGQVNPESDESSERFRSRVEELASAVPYPF